ncbi:acylneuraminate cytidylyltransferase family protein [Patescibacteria group bacterium]|nr:acylneuraminate cytidylyltransferase family protein [Patescibacteria group bacterium]
MNKKKLILGVITARGGSKGIPGKNIKLLGGKPLIAYTIEVAKKSKLITHLILSTDDAMIIEVSKKYGIDIPFVRPKELAQDDTKHLPVLQHAVNEMEKRLNIKFDYVIKLQPTSPLRLPKDIDGCIQALTDTDADSSMTMVEVSDNHPLKMKKIKDGRVTPFSLQEPEGLPRQFFPKAYKRSGACYALKRDNLILKNREYGDYMVPYLVPEERSIDIDSEFDWFKAEWMIKKLRQKGYDL